MMLSMALARCCALAALLSAPSLAATIGCNSGGSWQYITVSSAGSLSCSDQDGYYLPPGTASATASFVYAPGGGVSVTASATNTELGGYNDVDATVTFSVTETWLVTGGTGTGEIALYDTPWAGVDSIRVSPDADDQADFQPLGYTDDSGVSEAEGVAFTFGVPFSFDVPVYVEAGDDYVDGGSISFGYVLGSQSYQIPYGGIPSHYWQFASAGNPGLEYVTLDRTGVLDGAAPDPPAAPEPSAIWLMFAGLLVLGFRQAIGKLARAGTRYPGVLCVGMANTRFS